MMIPQEQFDESVRQMHRAYSQRANLAVACAKLVLSSGGKAGRGIDDKVNNDMEWRHVLYIELPGGEQVSYHFAPNDLHMLDGLPTYRGEWDGKFTGTTEWHEMLCAKVDADKVDCVETYAYEKLSGVSLRRWCIERRKLKADEDVSEADANRILLGYARAWSR